ncbi:MAG TPA: hypothetical protein VGF26_02785 [Ramlibacter sp.]
MNRLQAELHRLYLPRAAAREAHGLVDTEGRVRALVLELARPATWTDLSAVWQGVQADLDLPAPAIAVSGQGGYQLWFSLADPVDVDAARAFLESLCAHYPGGVAPERIRLEPSLDPAGTVRHVGATPPVQVAPERWSAFLTADLAPLFAEEPWLDHPPGVDAQADLLARLSSTPNEDFMRALGRLRSERRAQVPALASPAAALVENDAPRPLRRAADDAQEPAAFLLAVMRDPSVDLHLRVEAAKALLRR